jgi:PKD repeat protein
MRGVGYAVVASAAACVLVYGCNSELVTPVATSPTRHPTATPRKALIGGAQSGQWSAVFNWPIVGAHMSVLPDGRLLSWTSNDMNHTDNTPYVFVWDPANPSTFVQKPNAATDVFCSSHTFLTDGRLFVAGGHWDDNVGSKDGNIFDYQSSSWSSLPQMRAGRWYPSTVTLSSGEIGVASGSDENSQPNAIPEIWNGTNWRTLNGAPLAMPIYPWLHLAPDGRVFNAGPEQQTRYLNPSGDGEWVDAGKHIASTFRDYGTDVVYAPGKIIAIGGGDPPVNTAELVDLNVGTTWTSTASMKFARRQLNALVLADGKVLVVGGTNGPGFNNEAASILTPELWDPATGGWTSMSDMTIPRTYHSTAVLMPDARVLSAGGGRCGTCQVNHLDAQIFSPPYLFNSDGTVATRPTITSAPTPLNRGQSFTVLTPDAARITRATMARLPSTSHAFNMNQAFVSLSVTQVSGGVQLTAPPNPNLVPAGHYMLFLLDGNGVPSVAKIVQLLGFAPLPAPPAVPSAPSSLLASAASGTQINLKWNDNSTSESSFRIERCQGSGCSNFVEVAFVGANVSSYSNTGLTSGTSYSFRVRAMNAAGGSGYTNVASAGGGGSPNNPPVARFTWTCPTLQCTLDATTSTDDMGIASYKWDWGDGRSETKTLPTTRNTWATAGVYTVTLTVTDAGGLSNSTSQQVAVGTVPPPPNQPPTANFTSSCTNLSCTFTNTSTDDGTIASSSWTFGDGGTSTATSPSHGYGSAGTYSVSLTVTDDKGATNSTTKSVTVSTTPPPNTPPTANFTSSCTNLACSFTNTSTDPDGTIASSSWTFGDGSTSTATSPSHTYGSAGTYSVSLTVKDDKGASSSTTTKSVTVTASPPPPSITLTANGSKVKGVQQVDLSWTGATTSTVDLYRNGAVIASPANNTTTKSGTYHDNLNRKGSATYQYKVCQAGSTTVCSAVATVAF